MAPPGVQKRMTASQIHLKDLNPVLTCTLCRGYLIDATTLVDCLHVFCRACILRYFENSKLGCPTCNVVYKKKNNSCFRSDPIIQALVYKLVPGLYSKEVQRREDFYRSTGVRASSSCSEDSVLGDLNEEHEEWVSSTGGDQNQYLSPDDAISLSLEYYKPHLDTIKNSPSSDTKSTNYQDSTKLSDEKSISDLNNSANLSAEKTRDCDNNNADVVENDKNDTTQCALLQTNPSESFDDEFCDKKKCDRRYLQCPAAVTMSLLQKFLRMKNALSAEHRVDIIHSGEVLPQHFNLMDVAYTFKWDRTKPMRFFYRIFIPAKIQPIKIISSGKQLQVVPANASGQRVDAVADENKERLMANLELQKKQNGRKEENCIFEYQEPDKDEIREFAEKRDREWALQKKLDEEKEKHRNSKKRKKSKHSKNNLLYKKRKLHAEITSSESLQKEESLKLKVKLTPHNGYKHKHHKSSQPGPVPEVVAKPQPEMSSKEKLLQMRQVRHKHIAIEDKVKVAGPGSGQEEVPVEAPSAEPEQPEVEVPPAGKTLRSDFSVKTKEICLQKYPTVKLERNEQTERQAQKTFLKTFQSYTEKFAEKVVKNRPPAQNTYPGKNSQTQMAKTLEQKIANLHQQCTTVEPSKHAAPKLEKKVIGVASNVAASSSSSSYPSGFTVSKIEVGGKRKSENEVSVQDKRPSLEITLISPTPEKPKDFKPVAKRPPPPTIPLERIKKSMNRIAGLNIIPKIPEKCDNTGALDLSKPNKSSETMPVLNGLGKSPERVRTPEGNMQLSNLQMLSKVATEHSTINKSSLNLNLNKRLPMPSLQTLKIPVPQTTPKSNLAKLPKLNEINRTQFRMPNTQIRNMRPNQNQSIRNIPNPSLLVRQQNQNRLNSLSAQNPPVDLKQCPEPANGENHDKNDDKPKLVPDSTISVDSHL